jgi:hypothetical protein
MQNKINCARLGQLGLVEANMRLQGVLDLVLTCIYTVSMLTERKFVHNGKVSLWYRCHPSNLRHLEFFGLLKLELS